MKMAKNTRLSKQKLRVETRKKEKHCNIWKNNETTDGKVSYKRPNHMDSLDRKKALWQFLKVALYKGKVSNIFIINDFVLLSSCKSYFYIFLYADDFFSFLCCLQKSFLKARDRFFYDDFRISRPFFSTAK